LNSDIFDARLLTSLEIDQPGHIIAKMAGKDKLQVGAAGGFPERAGPAAILRREKVSRPVATRTGEGDLPGTQGDRRLVGGTEGNTPQEHTPQKHTPQECRLRRDTQGVGRKF
jgi:hypothetical protein